MFKKHKVKLNWKSTFSQYEKDHNGYKDTVYFYCLFLFNPQQQI